MTVFADDDSILKRSFYDMEINSGDGLTHLYYTKTPLFPFGWGKSYTTFTYNWTTAVTAPLEIGTEDLVLEGAVLEAACTVTNTGKRSGDAYVHKQSAAACALWVYSDRLCVTGWCLGSSTTRLRPSFRDSGCSGLSEWRWLRGSR